MSISREETQVEVNCYGVIRSMLNRNQGIIEVERSGPETFALLFTRARPLAF